MKNNHRFLFHILAAISCALLLSACGTSGPGSDADVPPQSDTITSQPLESEPPSIEPNPSAEPSPPVEPSPTAEIVASGVCGENAAWALDAEGTLTISGSGAIYGYMGYATGSIDTCDDPSQLTPPWNEHYDNQAIRAVVIEPGITYIGVGAFMQCPELIEVSIPDSVTGIGSSAFAVCPKLLSVDLPSGITILDKFVFTECTSLSTVFLSDTVTRVGDAAFEGCSNLSKIHIMGINPSIGKDAFWGCAGLTDITYGGTEQQWKDAGLDAVDFESKDYTIHFSDGSGFHYVYQEPMSQDEAHVLAYRYWGVDPDEAAKFGSDINPTEGNGIIEWNGRVYYGFKQYRVGTATYVWATRNEDISMIFIDAVTGEVFTNLS